MSILLLYLATTSIIICLYVFLVIFILEKWKAIPSYVDTSVVGSKKLPSFSFIIPVRNEEENITSCLNSIIKNKNIARVEFEIIVIDDYSEDETVSLIKSMCLEKVKLIHLKDYIQTKDRINAYKKVALKHALAEAQNEYIIQLDGDVVIPSSYLETLFTVINNTDADFIAGPVLFNNSDTIITSFQQLDFIGMMGVTGAGIQSRSWYMANGANMIYKKELVQFNDSKQASGDDIYTINKLSENKNTKILFLKNPNIIVHTKAQTNIRDLYQQRIRWATKNKNTSSLKMLMMMIVPFVNAFFLLIHIPLTWFFSSTALSLFFLHLFIKITVDLIYLSEIGNDLKYSFKIRDFLSSFILHPLYLVIIGSLSLLIKNYIWKGRTVN